MNRTSILKGLAICSSVLLAGGFVAYRQKQASAADNDEEPVMPGSKSKVILPSSKNIDAILANPGQPGASSEKVLLPSSKSLDMPVFKRPDDKKDPTLLPGSKSINREAIDSILNGRKKYEPDDETKTDPNPGGGLPDSKEKDKP